jgi:hypothetical protein
MASRFDDIRSTAYALASAIHLLTILWPKRVETFEELSYQAKIAARNHNDAYLQIFVQFAVASNEIHRGRMIQAHEAAETGIAIGRRMKDPRSIGFGMNIHAWAALLGDDYLGALNFAETGTSIARTPYDLAGIKNVQIAALVLLRRPEAFVILRDWISQCIANGWHWHLSGADGMWGGALVVHGEIGEGIRWMKQSISRLEREGYRVAADWQRMFLCEIYLEIISGNERPPAKVLARNMLTLVAVMFTAERRIRALVERVAKTLDSTRTATISVGAR